MKIKIGRVGPDSQVTSLLALGEICMQTHTQGECHRRMKAEIHSQGMPHISRKTPEVGEKHGTDSLSQPQKKTTLTTPQSPTSGLQK